MSALTLERTITEGEVSPEIIADITAIQRSNPHDKEQAVYLGGKCNGFNLLSDTIKQQAKGKSDKLTLETAVRLDGNLLLPGKIALSTHGLDTLASHTNLTGVTVRNLLEQGYQPAVVTVLNAELDKRAMRHDEKRELRKSNGGNPSDEPRKFLMRYRKNEEGEKICRAVVSEKFGICDNHHVVGMIERALKSLYGKQASDFVTCRPFNDGDNMVFNLFLPDRNNDGLFTGFSVVNSEVRKYKFRIDAYLFREYCTNGLIYGKQDASRVIAVKHIGDLDLEAIGGNVKRVMELSRTDGPLIAEQFKQAQNIKLTASPENLIAYLSKREGLTISQGQAWWKAYQVEPADNARSLNAQHLVNGLTRAAHNPQFDGIAANEMSAIGGKILTPALTANLTYQTQQWGRYNSAALDVSEKEVAQYVSRVAVLA